MKPVTLHLGSLLAGVALAALTFVAMGHKTVPTGVSSATPQPLGEHGDELQRQPKAAIHPRDWVQVSEGVPFTVPAGKLLAITALGSSYSQQSGRTDLCINGVRELQALGYLNINANYATEATSMRSVPRGLTAAGGSLVEVKGGNANTPDDARAWGLLVDA